MTEYTTTLTATEAKWAGLTLAPVPEPVSVGLCGMATKAGGTCRNRADACRWHAEPVTVLRKGTRRQLVACAPQFAGMSTREIREAVSEGRMALPVGWALPSGHVRDKVTR